MRGLHVGMAAGLVLIATQAAGKRNALPAFAEPGDIIAAEGNLAHLSVAKGVKFAIRSTAASDAQIFAPQLMHVTDYANRTSDPNFAARWHTAQVWMSCDGSIAVSHGEWQGSSGTGWHAAVWHRQKGGDYKWVLEESGSLKMSALVTDMIAASIADCPPRRAHPPVSAAAPAADRGKTPVDYTSGHSADDTLEWATTLAADGGPVFAVRLKQDGAWREVLRAPPAPPPGS